MEYLLDGMNEGELELYNYCKCYENQSFKVIPNLLIKRKDKGTSQIDLVVINKKGIFVFEMKDYKGWIFGNEFNDEWTQSIKLNFGKSKKYQFRNPVKQNENHIKTLRVILESNNLNYPIYNIVVFSNRSELKDISSSTDVINIANVEYVLEKYPDTSISDDEIIKIYEIINSNNIITKEEREAHLKQINNWYGNQISEDIKEQQIIDTLRQTSRKFSSESLNNRNGKKAYYNDILRRIMRNLLRKPLESLKLVGAFILLLFLIFSLFNNSYKSTNVIPKDKYEARESSNVNIFTLGSTREEVIKAIGQPKTIDSNNQNKLYYGPSWVSFDGEGKVNGWNNYNNGLSKGMIKGYIGAQPIKLYSSKDEVLNAVGAPNIIESNNPYVWYYGSGKINFNKSWEVIGWYNYNKVLDNAMQKGKAGASSIHLNSVKEDVLNALGSPTLIDPDNQYKWYYGSGTVSFNNEWKVIGWYNYNDQLKNGMQQAKLNSKPIRLFASQNEVLDALGSPTQIDGSNPYKWYYGSSTITFNKEWKVVGWYNYNNTLLMGMEDPTDHTGIITKGITQLDVIKIMGSPTHIEPTNQNQWYYGLAYINFDNKGNVRDWKDYNNTLKVK